MEKKNNIQEIIKDLTSKKDEISNQIKIMFESVDKFKHKRHLIILSYLLGYYFAKGNNLFNKDILQNSLEIFEKSLTRKTDMANLMIAIALSLNKCNEVEKVPEQNEKKNEKKEENKNVQNRKKNTILMDITETMLSTDPYKVYQELFGETVLEKPLTIINNNNTNNNINHININNKNIINKNIDNNINNNINNKNINNKNITNNKNINRNNEQNIIKNNKNIEHKKINNFNNNKNNNNKNYKIGNEINKNANKNNENNKKTENNNREINKNNNNINNNINNNTNIKEKDIIIKQKYSNSNNEHKNNNENNNKKNYYNILDDDKINNNNFKLVNIDNYENKTRIKTPEKFVKGNFNTFSGNIDIHHNPTKFKQNALINQNKPKKIIKCFICSENFNELDKQNYKLNCNCIIHSKCFMTYIINSIKNKKIPILCPKCKEEIISQIIYNCLNSVGDKNLINQYENCCLDLYLKNNAINEQNDLIYYLCPTPGCNNYVPCKKNEVKLSCSKCKKAYCIQCYRPWHNNIKCEEFFLENSFVKSSQLNKVPYQGESKYKYKECPKCQTLMLKEEGKNKILCVCGTSFCYQCGKIVKEKHEC